MQKWGNFREILFRENFRFRESFVSSEVLAKIGKFLR
jgi:hypothetical protein